MALNKKIFDQTLLGGSDSVYLRLNSINKTSFQITHPNTGTIVFRVSNSTNPVNITNPSQMASIGWSDFPIFDLSIPGYVYSVDLSLPQFVSPTTLILECLNCEYMQIVVSGTGQYIVEQHINTLENYVRED
ncbi:MAG TPA: hypothetical protein PLP33_28680 [Leptospiraceae bacterium]|nr:hypothetical protein [Saprospiraceae bacterium]HNC59437.1 hypothetical protein [Leptospiraceae bacterium]